MKKLSSFLQSIILFFVSLLIFLSLITYTYKDIPFLIFPFSKDISNLIGIGGAYMAFFLFFIFGYGSYFLPFCLFFLAWDKLGVLRFSGLGSNKIVNVIASLFFIIFLSAFIGLFHQQDTLVFRSSGMTGFFIATFFKKYLGTYGSFITVFLLMIVNAGLVFGFFFVDLFKGMKNLLIKLSAFIREAREAKRSFVKEEKIRPEKNSSGLFEGKQKKNQGVKPEIKVYTPKVNFRTQKDKWVSSSADFEGEGKVISVNNNKDEMKRKIEIQMIMLAEEYYQRKAT